MANAFQCDRCKKVDVGRPSGHVTYTNNDNSYPSSIDKELCHICNMTIKTILEDSDTIVAYPEKKEGFSI